MNRGALSFKTLCWLAVFCFFGTSVQTVLADGDGTDRSPPTDQRVGNPPFPFVQNDPAFNLGIQNNSPMSPDEIRRYRAYMKEKQKAMFDRTPPSFHQVQDTVRLHPGALPPVVRITKGYSGVLYVSDITGSPWEIVSTKLSSNAFTIERPATKSKNALTITAERPYRSADIILFLRNFDIPVPVRLISDDRHTDIKTRLVVPRMGPHPHLPDVGGIESTGTGIVSETDERFIAGIPPKGAIRLSSTYPDVSAWSYNGVYYIRTHHLLASPAFLSLERGDGNINLYKVAPTPVIILSVEGRESMVSLEEKGNG